jgi:hypothetical protein
MPQLALPAAPVSLDWRLFMNPKLDSLNLEELVFMVYLIKPLYNKPRDVDE